MKTVLTIAGSDCSGGAGIQADLKTIAAHKLYGMSAITALTAQNTTGVYGVYPVPPEFVAQQLDCIFDDIPPDAVKIGMVSSAPVIRAIGKKLRERGAKNVVVDPVMVSTSGSPLLAPDAVGALTEHLFPLAAVITPNLLEARALCGFSIETDDDALRAAETFPAPVLIKGGHRAGAADDLLYAGDKAQWFRAPRIDNPNTHGTGCTLSSAIACGLAQGMGLAESVAAAKEYLAGALRQGLNLGRGSGPVDHMYAL